MSDKVLHGVDGWLVLLVIGLIVLGPARAITDVLSIFAGAEATSPVLATLSAWLSFKMWTWGVVWTANGIGIGAGLALLWRHRPSSVTFAVIALWLIGPGAIVALLLTMAVTLGGVAVDKATPGMIAPVIVSCIVSGVWTGYLMRSKRVKNTYYGDSLPGLGRGASDTDPRQSSHRAEWERKDQTPSA